MPEKPGANEDPLSRLVSDSMQQIWSAGLGALSLAEKEGTRLFDTLTKLGESLESSTRKTASAASHTVSGAKASAQETRAKLEEMFELRVAQALNSLQIPTASDVRELAERVDRLSSVVDALSGDAAKVKTRKKSKSAKKKNIKKKKKSEKGGKKKKKKSKAR